MDRRDFMKLTAAASAAAVVPGLPKSELTKTPKFAKSWLFSSTYDHRTFNMARDCNPKHLFCNTVNERIEAWYWNLADILQEKGRAKWVITHPCTISNMFAFPNAWMDIALRENVPPPEVVLWKAGTRGFWINNETPEHHRVLVWAHRGYPTFWLNENIHFCGSVKRALEPRLTDRMSFVCEKGCFTLDTYWGDM